MWNYLYLAVCLLFGILLLAFFKSKQRIESKENSLFGILLYLCILSVGTELILQFVTINYGVKNFFTIFLSKFYLVTIIVWFGFFSKYIFFLFKPTLKNTPLNYDNEYANFLKRYNIINIIHNIILVILSILSFLLPIKYYISGDLMYSYGVAVDFLRLVLTLFVISWLIATIKNFKKILEIKYISILFVVVLLVANILLQKVNPSLLIVSFTLTFLSYIMYFTIENPDMKLVKETELAKEQADKANRAKTDFLSSMSHEIRTPLNAIVGFSECIEDATTLEEAKENAHDIVNASQTLLEIVNGILDISKIEAGKIEIVNSPYNARETFEDLATLITPKMNEKGLDFTYKIAPDIPQTLYGDHANLKKIVTNLLSNASKYTEHGFVHYEVNCVNSGKYSKLIITVEDSGRGIKKESVDKLFTKFQRLDEDKNTTIEGTGLGLAITKQLIELMGGKIIVHTIYGEGSKFTVVINQRIEEEKQEEKHHRLDTLDLNNVKLLLVDDNALNIKVANKILEKYNANMVTSVSSGFECLDKIKAGEKYDVILLDDMMPKMSGVETLQELKKDPNFNTPVIALTANAITGMREKYINEGFNDYLAKPIEKDQLIKVMNEILGRTITNQIPVEDIKEEVPEIKTEEEKQEDDDKNRIIQVSEDDVDLLKNQQLLSETSKINILDHDLDKVSIVKQNTEDSGEVLDIDDKEVENVIEVPPVDKVIEIPKADKIDNITEGTQIENVIDVPTDLLNNNPAPIDLPTVEEPPKINPEEYLRSKGVDLDKALENLGDMEMYDATVDDFLSEVEEKWQRIEDYKLQNNMKDYSVEVHSLKSDAKYLGLMRLADIAYQHELASKEDKSDYVNSNFNYLENEYQKALEIIKNYKETILK